MLNRGVKFDVIGESYYPKWHGTLQDLQSNLTALKKKYNRPVIVAECSQLKNEVNKIAFTLSGDDMKGTFIWEPLSTWEAIFYKDGKSTASLLTMTKYIKSIKFRNKRKVSQAFIYFLSNLIAGINVYSNISEVREQ